MGITMYARSPKDDVLAIRRVRVGDVLEPALGVVVPGLHAFIR